MSVSSTSLFAYPYSLSYHATTLHRFPPTTLVRDRSIIAECGFPTMSEETIGSSVTSTIPLYKGIVEVTEDPIVSSEDRKSTRLNSSHQIISYAVFCLKKKR